MSPAEPLPADPAPPAAARRHWSRSRVWPWSVLSLSLAATLAATVLMADLVEDRHIARINASVEEEVGRLQSRLNAYVALLHATRSFILAQGQALSAQSFREFIAGLDVRREFPGIQGIGYSPRVDPARLGAFEAYARRDVAPDFRVGPVGARDWLFSILYIEPLDERNRAALGYNMFSEPTRASAMAMARDTGQPALSGPVILRQEIDATKRKGFLIYVPLYRPPEPLTVLERQQRLQGFVYAPFRSPDFFPGAPAESAESAQLRRVYAAPRADAQRVLFDGTVRSIPDLRTLHRTIELHGQSWTFEFAYPQLSPWGRLEVALTALAGLVISVLLFLLVRSLRLAALATESVLASERAARLAAERQKELLDRQVQFGELLVGIVSHDLRNPLNVVMLNTELLQRGGLPPPLARSVERIREGGRMSLRLIRDLLDFTQARLGSGIPVNRQPGDLNAIVAKAVDELQATRGDHELVLRSDGDATGRWDADRMAQVVSNLVTNAFVYGAAGSPVTVTVEARGPRVLLAVHNAGPPIPPELQSVIFEPLRQGDGQEGRSVRNIGLGLYIVRQIADAHGGSVDVRSTATEGTTFRVELPRQ